MPKKWLTLPEVERLYAGERDDIRRVIFEGGRAGEFKSRLRKDDHISDGRVRWHQSEIDWDTSTETSLLYNIGDKKGYVTRVVEVDRATLQEYLAPDQKPKRSGGRRTVIPTEALIEVGAWLGVEGLPEKLVEVEDKLREAIDTAGAAEPAESTVRQWASKVVEAHRRALAKLG
jgi:hypothetical protein